MYKRMTAREFNERIAEPLGLEPAEIEDNIEASICQALVMIVDRLDLEEALRRKVHALTAMASDDFDSWHRIEFGSQAKVAPDVKTAYFAGCRSAVERRGTK